MSLTTGDGPPENHAAGSPAGKRAQQAAQPAKKKRAREKNVLPFSQPRCILIDGQGSCPEWDGLLEQYPMIDSVQREDFPEHGASFAYLAHFYRTPDLAGECSHAEKEFKKFFRTIGYKYDYSGDYESRWFEGVGVKIW